MVTGVSQDVAERFVGACREAGERAGAVQQREPVAAHRRRTHVGDDDAELDGPADGGRRGDVPNRGRGLSGRQAADRGSEPARRPASHRPEIDVVMHFQAPHATTLACRESRDVNFFVIPEIPFYIGPIGRVPYLPPGSQELADAVVKVMRDHNLALMANHGQVTVARDLNHVIQNAELRAGLPHHPRRR